MKSKRIYRILLSIGVMSIIIGAIVVVRDPIFMDSQEISYPDVLLSGYPDTGSYGFNSETILQSLDHGETDVFILPSTPVITVPSTWKQADYLRVANVLHQYVWKEPLDDWALHDMTFYGDCKSDPIKIDLVNITYYKNIPILQYTAHMIEIYPLSGEVAWGGGEAILDLFSMNGKVLVFRSSK